MGPAKTLAAIVGPGNIGTDLLHGYVGGQEDMIIDIAVQLAAERDLAATGASSVPPRRLRRAPVAGRFTRPAGDASLKE